MERRTSRPGDAVGQTAVDLSQTDSLPSSEREAIARELHDKLGQYLTVMALEFRALDVRSDLTDEVRHKLKNLADLTTKAQHDIANLAWQVRPVSLGEQDLESACRQLIEEWSARSQARFDLHASLGSRKLRPEVETTLYRVLQEALTNVAKHAAATRIGVIFRVSARDVVMMVEDDGIGFSEDPENASSLSLGLKGARERLALISGNLEIETSPGGGTTVLVSVPL